MKKDPLQYKGFALCVGRAGIKGEYQGSAYKAVAGQERGIVLNTGRVSGPGAKAEVNRRILAMIDAAEAMVKTPEGA